MLIALGVWVQLTVLRELWEHILSGHGCCLKFRLYDIGRDIYGL